MSSASNFHLLEQARQGDAECLSGVGARDEKKVWFQTPNEYRLIAISTVGCYALTGLWRRKPDDSNDRIGYSDR